MLGIEAEQVFRRDKRPQTVKARGIVLLGAKGVGNEYDRTGKRIRNHPIGDKPMYAEGGEDRSGGNIDLRD